ncbi:IS481 family transposase [Mycobacterium sp. PS03-16]|uniref:IS481 family transposase n=1 Tax=Mycobacterium sp. PS03-16 TaxID=2559611 RepID=UPI001072FE30|nr:IS481 family transposase [Mycobacterium sp. PS03-16]TFV54045.1 IS481 family transposase [Mycobacterium sp. PS03-16]
MSHANARLTVHGRQLLVDRVLIGGRKAAHVAAELGVSRQCAHRWVKRYLEEGPAGLVDRSSRPHRCPRRTTAAVESAVVELRRSSRRGQDWIGAELGLPARTVSAILRRHHLPYLRDCDPLTGEVIRASKTTAVRYERARPGELIHMDVKKIGRIPNGGGWRANGRGEGDNRDRRHGSGYDYVHSAVDDHSRLAYSEILPDEKGPTCAAFLARAADYYAAHGIAAIERIITDNHWSYRHSHDVAAVVADLGARHVFIKPHCPWQNGKVERYNRTLQTEWAYRQVFTTNDARCAALAPWLDYYNNQRRHSALGGQPPTSRLSPT